MLITARFIPAVLFVITVAFSPVVYAEGKDILWEVTYKMEMPSMLKAMPSQTNKVCTPAEGSDENKVPLDKNCRILESKQTGNTFTYNMVCDYGGYKMTGTGQIVSNIDNYEGSFRVQKTGVHGIDMTTNFSGRKVGSCTARK